MKRESKYFFFFLFSYFHLVGYTQISDNFSDGNFTSNPAWTGNDTDFVVNSIRHLQLSSSGTGTSYLKITNTQSLNNCEWNFWINLNFSPSSSNYARVYLVSDQQSFSGSLNGYYLQFGENLSNDKVELFKQTGTVLTSICRTITPITTAFTIRVKVTRDNSGLWKLYIDAAGGTNYVLEATGADNMFKNTSCFGVYCNYTATNAAQFFFDDIYIYSPPDSVPAVLDSIKEISQNQVDVYFNEPLNRISAQTIANYFCDNGIGFPSAAVQDINNASLIHLAFPTPFSNGKNYNITATGVQDIAGNNTLHSTKSFLFFFPLANDVVINEIMADINPLPNNLPPYEYIELYNRTNFPVYLNGWTLSDATSSTILPAITILPDSFYVLTSVSGASLFGSTISVSGLSTFPSLNDTGDDLILRNANGNIIARSFYRSDWYNNPIKENGGWSLEQIDPNSPCSGIQNWKASANNSGGTPGNTNSVFASLPDIIPPTITNVTIISNNSIQLFFDEPMDSLTLMNLPAYHINGMGNPISANPVEPDYTSVILALSSPTSPGIIYKILVNGVRDCASNLITSGNTAQFALPEPVMSNDIVINEILFDPKENGVEWVEIYNRSNKIIDLKDVFLCSQNDMGHFTDIQQISLNGYLFFPQTYIVISTDAAAIKREYSTVNTNGFINTGSIPSMNNDSDYVVLITVSQIIIDKLQYHSEWHLPLLNDSKGISLERINYENTTQDKNNWHSASENAGGATPAYKNSQYTNGEINNEITISPEVFSPDNDGYNDVLSISYMFDTPAMVGNLTIYDSRGSLVRSLVQNEVLATSGTFFWDGITNDKLKARIGIYIVYFEAFDTQGNVKKDKQICVIGGKLE